MGGMGGMGGPGRSNSAFSFSDDDDNGSPFASFGGGGSHGHPFNAFSSMGGMPGGMPRQRRASHSTPPRGGRQSPTPSDIVRPLKVTLEELHGGVTKKLKIGRRLLSGQQEEK